MSPMFKWGAAAAAVLVVAVVGYNLLPRSGFGGPGATPTPAPTPTRAAPSALPSTGSVSCEDDLAGCAGPISAGGHRTVHFAPAFGFATPADWTNQIDTSTLYAITPIGRPDDLILVWSGVVPAEDSATCRLQAKAGVGTTAANWVAYLTSHPGLDAKNVKTVTLQGATAQAVDVRSFGGWTSPCVDDRANFNVPLLKTPDGAPGDGYGVSIGAQARIYLVDVGDQTVVISAYAYGGSDADFAAAIALAEPVVASFDFTP